MRLFDQNALPPERIWGQAFHNTGQPPVSHYRNAIIIPNSPAVPGRILADGQLAHPGLIARGTGEMPFYRFDARQPPGSDETETEHIPEAVYCGWMFNHFGHFLIETVSRLWYCGRIDPNLPLIFHTSETVERTFARSAQAAVLRAVGAAEHRVVACRRRIKVDSLHVPWPAIEIRRQIYDLFYPFTQQLGQSIVSGLAAQSPRKVYLSRSKLDTGNRWLAGEPAVENIMTDLGFVIAHPESMGFPEQIALLQDCETICGFAGSAFHTLLFARPNKRTLYLVPEAVINANLHMIDKARGDHSTFGFVDVRIEKTPDGKRVAHIKDGKALEAAVRSLDI